MDSRRKTSVRFSQTMNGQSEPRPSQKSQIAVEDPGNKPIDIFNDPLYNKDRTRNMNIPYELFVERRQKALRDREKKKREIRVSAITDRDKEVYEEALERLDDQREQANAGRMKYLWNLERSRAQKLTKPSRPETKAAGDTPKFLCPMTYPTSRPRTAKLKNSFGDAGSDVEDEFKMDFETLRATKLARKKSATRRKSKSQLSMKEEENDLELAKKRTPKNKPFIKLPPLKTKPWRPPQKVPSKIIKVVNEDGEVEFIRPLPRMKKRRFPSIIYPKFKTCKWVPPKSNVVIPEKKVVKKIEYPPLKMRKRPCKPIDKKPEKKPNLHATKTINPIPRTIIPKRWHQFVTISPKMHVLQGDTSQYSKKFSFVSNGKQSALIAAAALSTQEITPTKSWSPQLLDEIVLYGDINYRRQMRRFKRHTCIKPSDINSRFYLKSARLRIAVGASVLKGVYDPESPKEIVDHLNEMLSLFSGMIFIYSGQCYAIWKEDSGFFVFNSEDTNEEGKLVARNKGACSAVRGTSVQTIADYLVSNFRVNKQVYEIHSFRVEGVITIADEMAKMAPKASVQEKKKISPPEVLIEIQNFDEDETQADLAKKNAAKPGLASILFHHQTEPTFGDHFQRSSLRDHTYITCQAYLKRAEKSTAPYVSSVAVVMLRICKSSLWTPSTIGKIFQIGQSLYAENVESVQLKREAERAERIKLLESIASEEKEIDSSRRSSSRRSSKKPNVAEIREKRKERLRKLQAREAPATKDISITEIQPVVAIGKLKLVLAVESMIIGKVLSRNSSELSLQAGVDNLFRHYDYGLIIGHDVVAIWREQNHYFMFDPNQCEQFRRADDDEGILLNSCLNCFKSTVDLVKLYIDNLPKDDRNTVFKIFKIESHDFVETSNDWQNFRGIGSNKWILSGHICEASEEFRKSNRNNQSTCMALATLAKTRELGVMHWTSSVVDECVRLGDEFYSGCLLKLREQGEAKSSNLKLSETLSELKLEKMIVDFCCEESVVSGFLDSFALYDALKEFFANDDLAVLTTLGVSLAVFRYHDEFYLFDSKPRDAMGRNFKTVDPINSCNLSGTACILRFTCLCNLALHVVANCELADSPTFTIGKVDISVRTFSDPCYFNYTRCGHLKYGAMLRTANNYHEDSEQFKCDAVEKTLCNLLSCLCFTKVLNPRNWAPSDLNEIMKIGLKFFCKVVDKPSAMWNLLKEVESCSVAMKIKRHDSIQCVFIKRDALLPMIEEEQLEEETVFEEVDPAEVAAQEEAQKQAKQKRIDSGDEVDEEKESEDDETVTQKRSSLFPQALVEQSLMEVLQAMDEKEEAHAILTSSLFNLAVFKMNKFYFVFDPKESNGDGKLVRRRLEDFIKRSLVKERDGFLEHLQQSNDNQRISQEEEFQELLFGRPVVFGAPTAKPSQMHITPIHRDDDDECEEDECDGDDRPVRVSEMGSAYVSWFTTLDLIYHHVIHKIPEKFRHEQFTLNYFDITPECAEEAAAAMEQWHNLEAISKNHWIVRGTFSQNDASQFLHRNLQDSANCVMALIFAKLCNDSEWNATVLDVVLSLGDRLHRKSSAKHEMSCKLKIKDLDMPVFIRPFIISMQDELIKQDFIVKKDDKTPLKSLKNAVKEFFSENTAAILISKDYHVAVWKVSEDDSLIMFDPHDIGPDGRKKSTGLACLQRFTSHSDLIDIFVNNVKDIEGSNEYHLFKITVTTKQYNDDQNECPELPITMNQKVKTIRGKAPPSKSLENIPMTICHAIATVCFSRSLDAEFYTPDIIDKIVMLGNELARECRANEQICFKDFDLNRKTPCRDEINFTIHLHDTTTTVHMDIFQRGVISKNLCPLPNLMFSLEEFFSFHKAGVLITQEFIVAIWKERCKYFIFYSCKIDEMGRVVRCGQPGIVIVKSVHELYSNVISNVQRQDATFELRLCVVTMSEKVEASVCLDSGDCGSKKKTRKAMKKLLNEEVIVPAVSRRSDIDVSKETKKEEEADAEDDEELREMIRNMKKRNGKTCGFIEFSRGGFMCGRLSRKSRTFNKTSRKFHTPAICVAAAAMNTIKSMNCWSGDIIDHVVIAGNSLYIESSIICGATEVAITSLVTLTFMADREIETKAESCFEFAHENLKVEQLKATLDELLSCYGACYIRKLWDCWTIVKNDGFVYLFDPLGIEVPLKKVKVNRATLYRFDCMTALVREFLEISKKLSNDNIEIGGIITKLKKQEEKPKPKSREKKKSLCPEIPKRPPPIMMVPDLPEKCENERRVCCEFFECP